MKTFEELCSEVEAIKPNEYFSYIRDNTKKLIAPLTKHFDGNENEAKQYLMEFYIASIYGDGKFKVDEFNAMIPMIEVFYGEAYDFYLLQENIKKGITHAKKSKRVADEIADIIGNENDEIKEELVKLSLVICSTDGKISPREKAYIKQLIK